MTLDNRRLLRDAFGSFMTGVTVVTTTNEAGEPIGFTANSFSSVSLDPPLLLVSIAKTSSNYATFAAANGFAVNILAEGQKDVSNTFARPVEDRFATVKWQPGPHGAPVLADVSAWFDCSLHQMIEAGDHAILIGRVEGFNAANTPGLGYYRGSYFTPAQASVAVASGPAVVVSAIIERSGEVLLVDDGAGGVTLPTSKVGRDGASAALARLIAVSGVEATPGFIYSVFEDAERGHQHISFLCPATGGKPSEGCFVDLSPESLGDVTDPALRVMLERLAEESRVGNYGIYFGNQNSGQVRRVSEGAAK
jgi:flavin reductase (DIM6/NTAB) family NADH-FMN oxidoreductase RutF